MSYWVFTDIFEEGGPRFTPFHGGFGTHQLQGIRKPAFFAYQFLAQLGAEDIATNDQQSWITKRDDGSCRRSSGTTPPSHHLTTRPTRPSTKGSNLPAAPPTTLKIRRYQDGSYEMNVYRTGYKQNDAYTAWLHMGSPNQLTRQQVTSLQTAASGAPIETHTITIQNGVFEHEFDMHENGTVLVTLKKQ